MRKDAHRMVFIGDPVVSDERITRIENAIRIDDHRMVFAGELAEAEARISKRLDDGEVFKLKRNAINEERFANHLERLDALEAALRDVQARLAEVTP